MHNQSQNLPHSVRQGLRHFNNRSFFEAHEDFEDAWRETPGEVREFYRALLQISGGFFRLSQGNPTAANKFFSLALNWMEPFPPTFQGIPTDQIKQNVQNILDDLVQEKDPESILNHRFQPIITNNTELE